MSELAPKIANSDQLERALLGSVLIARDPHDVVAAVSAAARDLAGDMSNLRHVVLWRVFETLRDDGLPITPATVEHQLAKQGNLEAVGGVAFIGELALDGAHGLDVALASVPEIQTAAINRRAIQLLATAHERARAWPHDAAELVEETRADLERLEKRLPGRRTYHTVEQVVAGMRRFAELPWIPFALGGEIIAELPLGESLYLMGPSGSGKTTLAFCFAAHHARHCGPVLIVSRELSEETAGARLGSMLSGASWSDVLRGRAIDEAAAALLDLPRLLFLDEDRTTFTALRRAIAEAKADFPGEPIMVLVDYVQILEASARGGELRQRTNDAVDELRRLILAEKLLGLVLSQMSREVSRAAKRGERLGSDAGDGGAESAAIERAAAITAEIGRQVEVTEPGVYGAKDVQLSIGKGRYGGGDRVVELRQWGASGLTRVLRDEPASEVREREREQREKSTAKQARTALESAIMDAADRAAQPFSREELCEMAAVGGGKKKQLARTIIADLLASGALVETTERRPRSTTPLLWTRDRAASSSQNKGGR